MFKKVNTQTGKMTDPTIWQKKSLGQNYFQNEPQPLPVSVNTQVESDNTKPMTEKKADSTNLQNGKSFLPETRARGASEKTLDSNTPQGGRETSTAIRAREELLLTAEDVLVELSKRAKGEFYNDQINLSDQLRIMDYAIPIIQQTQDQVHLENLATQTPEERTNTILQAVATGKISAKNAMELVNVMKSLQELTNPSGAEDGGKLIINLAPQVAQSGLAPVQVPEKTVG